jgi:hypothetical protein
MGIAIGAGGRKVCVVYQPGVSNPRVSTNNTEKLAEK